MTDGLTLLRYALFGNPPTPGFEPNRQGMLDAITQVEADSIAASAASATAAAASALAAGNVAALYSVLPSVPSALPYEVTAISGGIGTGTGGTNGTYVGGVTGGPLGFQWTYTITGGTLASYAITNPGIAATNSAPTLSFPAGGLVSPTIPTAAVATIPVNRVFWGITADSQYIALWKNAAGSLAAVVGPGGNQVTQLLIGASGSDPMLAVNRSLSQFRNLIDPSLCVLGSYFTAGSGTIGTGGSYVAITGSIPCYGGETFTVANFGLNTTPSFDYNSTGFIFFNAAGYLSQSGAIAAGGSFTAPAGATYMRGTMQLYYTNGSIAGAMVVSGSVAPAAFKNFDFLESIAVTHIANKARKGAVAPIENLVRRSDLSRDYSYNGAGVLTSLPSSQCWATGLLRCDTTRGITSNLPIVLTGQGVSFFDIDKNFLFSNGNTFTANTTNTSNSIVVTATANGKPLCLGALVDCATGGVVPGLSATCAYITGIPANGAALGTYTISQPATNTGTHTDMRAGGMAAGVTLYPPVGYVVAYVATTYYYYFLNTATPDQWEITDGPMVVPTAIAGASSASLGIGIPDLEILFPWYKQPVAVLGNSINSQALNDYFTQITKCDLQLHGAVPATQLHQFLDGCRIAANGAGRNTVTGNINGVFTSADFNNIKAVAIGPLGGNEEGYNNGGGVLGNDITGQHRQPYPVGLITYTAPVSVFQVASTAGSTTITVSGQESGAIIPGPSCLFPTGAPGGLGGRYIASQTGGGSVTGATASFATNVMTVTVAGTGSFAVGQTVTSAGVAPNTYISSLGTGTGGTGTYNLSTSPGTLAAQAVSATNIGGNGTYVLDASTGVTTGGPNWTTVGTFYGSLYWLCVNKLGSWAPKAIPFLITMYPRYDLGSGNGGPTDANNPGNPINSIAVRTSDYVDAVIAFCRKFHFPVIDMFYNTPFGTTLTAAMLQTDLLHPRQYRPPSGLDDQGVHVYAGRVGRVMNHYSPAVSVAGDS